MFLSSLSLFAICLNFHYSRNDGLYFQTCREIVAFVGYLTQMLLLSFWHVWVIWFLLCYFMTSFSPSLTPCTSAHSWTFCHLHSIFGDLWFVFRSLSVTIQVCCSSCTLKVQEFSSVTLHNCLIFILPSTLAWAYCAPVNLIFQVFMEGVLKCFHLRFITFSQKLCVGLNISLCVLPYAKCTLLRPKEYRY
jgi:hypothetical protein